MSGMVFRSGGDDVQERIAQRLHQLTQRNPENLYKSRALSTVGSLSESNITGQYFNNKGQSANGTLTTHQFYKNNCAQEQSQAGNVPSNKNVMECNGSTYTGVSDASVFKKPLPVKRSNYDPRIRIRFDLMVESCISCLSLDKPTLKLMMFMIETIVHTLKKTPYDQPMNPIQLMDYISNVVKEVYSAKQFPKSICGSSVTSDQASNVDHYSRGVLQDITQSSVYRAQCNRNPQDLSKSECSTTNGRTAFPNHYQQETTAAKAAMDRERSIIEKLIESGYLNDTEIAQRRDEAAARQEESLAIVVPKRSCKMLPKSSPKQAVNASKVSRVTKATTNKKPNSRRTKESSVPVSDNSNMDRTNQNISLMNGTARGTTRCGRTLKAPVKYWNSKADELSFVEADESIFDQSMTLRNKKVIDKKKTPPLKKTNSKTPTLPKVPTPPPTTKRNRGGTLATGKENMTAEKKKPVNKQADNTVVKNNSAKEKTNRKKAEVTKPNTEKVVKKPAPKRKSKEPINSTSKKKKIEDPLTSDDEEDDIFGSTTYRKPTLAKVLKVALSPTSALLSAKKAAGEAQGKATPPCKAIGDMIGNESIQSAMSAAKEAPKQNEAIKRIIKKMEKDQMKPPSKQPKAKTQVKKTQKEDSNFNELMGAVKKSSYFVDNSMCQAKFTVSMGNELESDISDMEQDDDDLM